jgi:hypothetical protein
MAVGLAWLACVLALGWHLIAWWADVGQFTQSTANTAGPSPEFVRWFGR